MIYSPALAYWNQRGLLAQAGPQLLALLEIVGRPGDMSPRQAAQILAVTLDYHPSLILELGRGFGNSTCVFTQAARLFQPASCRVVSICREDSWHRFTLPKLSQQVPAGWFEPLEAIRADITEFPFETILGGCEKVLIFWDAHGFKVAECVLGSILPQIAERPHLVLMHDLTDTRYCPTKDDYGSARLWTGGNDADSTRFRLNHIDSGVEQAIAALDFTSRNKIGLHSADHDLHLLAHDGQKLAEMRGLLGDELFSLSAHWYYFSLNERPGPYTFPRWVRQASKRLALADRLRKALRILIHGE